MSILDPDFVQQVEATYKMSTYTPKKPDVIPHGSDVFNRYLRHQANLLAKDLGFKTIQGLWSSIRSQGIGLDLGAHYKKMIEMPDEFCREGVRRFQSSSAHCKDQLLEAICKALQKGVDKLVSIHGPINTCLDPEIYGKILYTSEKDHWRRVIVISNRPFDYKVATIQINEYCDEVKLSVIEYNFGLGIEGWRCIHQTNLQIL